LKALEDYNGDFDPVSTTSIVHDHHRFIDSRSVLGTCSYLVLSCRTPSRQLLHRQSMSMVTQPTRAGLVSTSPVQGRSTHDGNPKTPLREVISNTGFVFPAIWSFPPFYT
jgi:hypothetical protein